MADRPLRIDPRDRPGYPPDRPPMRQPGRNPRQRRRPPRRVFGGIARLGLLLLLWCAIFAGGTLAYFAFTLPDTSQLGIGERRPSITILAQDGSMLASFGDLFGQPVTLKEMSRYLPEAV